MFGNVDAPAKPKVHASAAPRTASSFAQPQTHSTCLLYTSPLIEKEVDYPGLLKAHAKTMAEAVREARAMAKPGDTILLSPACASWDMFKDYADRSAQFVAAAKEIAEEEGQLC